MGVGFKVGRVTDEIGTADFFYSFFSTIAVRLEPKWGARFPVLMTKLYQGELRRKDAHLALRELATIQLELKAFAPSEIVWDFQDRTKSPPWGDNIDSCVTDLSNYFCTSAGRDLIEMLREKIETLRDRGGVGQIVAY